MSGMISVCVLGAGPAGLCAARHLAANRGAFSFDVYERSGQVGGTWQYTEETGIDEHGLPVHSSLYSSLRTNFLQELMAYPDFPFPEAGENSYPSHDVVLKYLQDYTAHFKLSQYIQFHTVVKRIKPCVTGAGKAWCVIIYNVKTKLEITKIYDSVMICTGNDSVPSIPNIPGIESFKGHIMHCHDYRHPDRYKNLSVAVLGASFSGKDISLEIASVAEKVYICHSLPPLAYKLPSNICEVASIKEARADGFTLDDGLIIKADALLYCTGYKYDFPFLSDDCGISVRGRRVVHLYKHMINIENPKMALIGIPYVIIPFPFFYYQVAYFLKTLKQPTVLPSKKELYESEELDFQKRLSLGHPPRHAHKMADMQWDYTNSLADMTGIPRLPPVYRELCDINSDYLKNSFITFRNESFAELFKKKMEMNENKYSYTVEIQELEM